MNTLTVEKSAIIQWSGHYHRIGYGLLQSAMLRESLRRKPTATFDSLLGCMEGELDDPFMDGLSEIRRWGDPTTEPN